jgi:hypothetical protein
MAATTTTGPGCRRRTEVDWIACARTRTEEIFRRSGSQRIDDQIRPCPRAPWLRAFRSRLRVRIRVFFPTSWERRETFHPARPPPISIRSLSFMSLCVAHHRLSSLSACPPFLPSHTRIPNPIRSHLHFCMLTQILVQKKPKFTAPRRTPYPCNPPSSDFVYLF